MKEKIQTLTKPTVTPPKRLCNPASGVLATPTAARFPASLVLRTTQERSLASQESRAAGSGLSGEPARAGNLAVQARSRTGCKRLRQRLNRSESASGHDWIAIATDQAVKRKDGNAPKLPAPKRGREATHYPETAASPDVTATVNRGEVPASTDAGADAHETKPESVSTTVRRAEPQGETRNTGLLEPDRSAAKLSEQWSHRRFIYRRSGTGCAANRSLRAVHRWQRRCAKRPDNVPPRTRGPATARKPVESASYKSGQGARLAGKVNASEWLVNVVIPNKRK